MLLDVVGMALPLTPLEIRNIFEGKFFFCTVQEPALKGIFNIRNLYYILRKSLEALSTYKI